MKKILTFNGSPRANGNTSILLQNFIDGAKIHTDKIEQINPNKINLKYCTGCLSCNLYPGCIIKNDDWSEISNKILESDVIVFATPIYGFFVPAPLKIVFDRFYSFIRAKVIETSLHGTPWHKWKKDIVLIITMGAPVDDSAKPVIDLFKHLTSIFGEDNNLHIIIAKRLVFPKQINKTPKELTPLYKTLKVPQHFIKKDYMQNQIIKQQCYELGKQVAK